MYKLSYLYMCSRRQYFLLLKFVFNFKAKFGAFGGAECCQRVGACVSSHLGVTNLLSLSL